MLQRSRASVLALMLACGSVAAGAPASAAETEPSGWLELNAGPDAVFRLEPGGSAQWPVNVYVRGEPATSLEVMLQPEPGAPDLLRGFLSVELRSCSRPWVRGQCGAAQKLLVQRTALNSAEGLRADLMEPGNAVSDGAYVLLTASLAYDVPREVQGSKTQILVGVYGSGDDPGDGPGGTGNFPGQPAGQPWSSLADTGARLGGFALLGLLAVAVGFGLARLRAAA